MPQPNFNFNSGGFSSQNNYPPNSSGGYQSAGGYQPPYTSNSISSGFQIAPSSGMYYPPPPMNLNPYFESNSFAPPPSHQLMSSYHDPYSFNSNSSYNSYQPPAAPIPSYSYSNSSFSNYSASSAAASSGLYPNMSHMNNQFNNHQAPYSTQTRVRFLCLL
jgi:hypothetical protein